MNFRAKMDSLEGELRKLKVVHLCCNVERRRLERKLEVKNDELEDLKRELGFSKDAEAKAIKKYKRALEYNIEVEAEVAELKTRFAEERGQLLGQLSHLKEKLRGKTGNLEAGLPSKRRVIDVKCSSKSTKDEEFAKPTALFERKPVGENRVVCDRNRKSYGYDQYSNSADFSSDASNHSDDGFSDASDHEQYAEQTNNHIFLKMPTGKKIAIKFEPLLRICDLMYKIEDKVRIPVDQQRLIFHGRLLVDGCTLTDCGIQKNSVIDLFLRLRGG